MATDLRLVRSDPDERQVATLVDSNVILDIATKDDRWGPWSREALRSARNHGGIVINPVIYAEVSVGYTSIEALDRVIPPADFEREELPCVAGFLAGKAYLAYWKRGGNKRSPLADFYIGAHAATRSYRVLTRDAARYRTYFPTVELMLPES